MVRLIRLRRQGGRKLLAWSPISLKYSLPMVKGIYPRMRKTERHRWLAPTVKPWWWTESPHERLGKGRIAERWRKRSERLWKKGSFKKEMRKLSRSLGLSPSYPAYPLLMVMMYNLSCYKGKTYHIEPCSGYWPWRCNFNVVNQNDCSVYCNARQRHLALMVSEMRQGTL